VEGYVAAALSKLSFASRAQLAGWVVEKKGASWIPPYRARKFAWFPRCDASAAPVFSGRSTPATTSGSRN